TGVDLHRNRWTAVERDVDDRADPAALQIQRDGRVDQAFRAAGGTIGSRSRALAAGTACAIGPGGADRPAVATHAAVAAVAPHGPGAAGGHVARGPSGAAIAGRPAVHVRRGQGGGAAVSA